MRLTLITYHKNKIYFWEISHGKPEVLGFPRGNQSLLKNSYGNSKLYLNYSP